MTLLLRSQLSAIAGSEVANKRLTRLNYRGRAKVNTQWNLYCMVHNIEKLSKTGLGRGKPQ